SAGSLAISEARGRARAGVRRRRASSPPRMPRARAGGTIRPVAGSRLGRRFRRRFLESLDQYMAALAVCQQAGARLAVRSFRALLVVAAGAVEFPPQFFAGIFPGAGTPGMRRLRRFRLAPLPCILRGPP